MCLRIRARVTVTAIRLGLRVRARVGLAITYKLAHTPGLLGLSLANRGVRVEACPMIQHGP